ncbi:MAG: hypothetical protein ABSG99_00380 [Sedimentisphaerales bacterium]
MQTIWRAVAVSLCGVSVPVAVAWAWLSNISDVVWAAMIASGLTYFGVLLTNKHNKKCLLLQLNHSAQQKDKEREMQIRKETYIEAAEAIAEAIKDIQRLPIRIIHSNNAEIGDKLLPAIAKVHMVGTLNTIKVLCQFMANFNQQTFPIIPEINRFITLKQTLVSLNSLSEYQTKSLNEIDSKFEKMDVEGKKNTEVSATYKKMFDEMKAKHDSTVAVMMKKEEELTEFQPRLLSMCLKVAAYLQKESLSVTLSMRKELNMEINSAEYLSEMDKVFKTYSDYLTPEKIEKLIHGN